MSKDTPAEVNNEDVTAREILEMHIHRVDGLHNLSDWHIGFLIQAMREYAARKLVAFASPPDAGKEQEAVEDVLRWYQSKGDEYRNNTLLTDCVKDYTLYKQQTK